MLLFSFQGGVNMWRVIVLLFLLAPSRGQQTRSNRVVDVTTTCDKGSITVHLEMAQPFKGLLFSKDFSKECQVQGKLPRIKC